MKNPKQKNLLFTRYFFLLIFLFIILFKNSDAQLYYNTAVSLQGTSESYLTGKPNTINLTGAFAIQAWIFPTSNSESCIIRKGAAQTYYGISIGNNGKLTLLTNNVVRVQSLVAIPINKWTHVTAMYDGISLFKFYINGFVEAISSSAGNSPLPNTDSLYIGKKGTELVANPFEGYLDEIRIWDRKLTPAEILENYRTSLVFSLSGVYSGLKASYTFQSDNPIPYVSIYSDYALNGNTLTPHNVYTVDFSNTPSRNLSFNEAIKLDGNGDYLSIVNSSSCSPTNGITIEAWVYPEDKIQNMAIAGKNSLESYYLGLTVGPKVAFAPTGFNNGSVFGNQFIPRYQWTHIAVTYESGMAKIYVNGLLDAYTTNITGAIPVTNDPFCIGSAYYNHNPDFFFKGYLDCVRLSDFIKTQEQIKDFMYQSIDEINRFDPNAKELSYNFDGYGSSSTIIINDVALFYGDAKFSNPATLHSVPVSPVNRLSTVDFSNDWKMKTCVNRRIPESGTSGNTKTDSLYISGAGTIGGMKLFLALNHTKVSDLEVTLFTPAGDSVKVYNKQLLPQTENEIITIFDDEAFFSLGNNYPCISFGPTVKPNSELSNLYGGSMNGYWKLKILDTNTNDTGRVYAWGLYNDATLPVELSSLSASVHSNNVTLHWTTSTELNNSIFEIERFKENSEWRKIGSVAGNGTTSSSTGYSFTDKNLSSGKYNYRIKQIDYNGNFEYFNLNSEVNIGIPTEFSLSQNYPNPFNPSTTISFDLPFDSKVSIKLFDMSGRETATLLDAAKPAGYHSINFNASNLSSGVYFYRISAEANGKSAEGRFESTKKMMLIK